MLKLLITALLFVSFVIAADAQTRLRSIQRSYDYFLFDGGNPGVSAHGDTIVTSDWVNNALGFSVFKRQQSGAYEKIASIVEEQASALTVNNGKWMGGWSSDGYFRLFQLDPNGAISNNRNVTIPPLAYIGDYVTMLSDNTIIFYDRWSENFTSLLFNAADTTWTTGPGLYAPNLFQMSYPGTTCWVTDNYLVYMNSSFWTFLYQRQQDGSWIHTDGFAFNASIPDWTDDTTLYYNGHDTVVHSFPIVTLDDETTSRGIIVLNTKINNTWTTQIITSSQLNFRVNSPGLGYGAITSIDDNTLILGAVYEDSNSKKRGWYFLDAKGRAVVLQRQKDLWVPSVIVYSEEFGNLGARVMVTNHDILLTFNSEANGRKYIFHSIPRCIFQPIDVTCSNIEVSTCQIDTSNPTPLAYSLGDRCEGVNTTVSVRSFDFEEEFKVTTELEFSRLFSTASCTATLTCPRPPSVTLVSLAPSESVVVKLLSLAIALIMVLY